MFAHGNFVVVCLVLGFFFVLHKVQFSFNAFLFCWFTVQHISTTVHNKSWKIQYPLQVWLISPQYSFFLSLLLILFISFFLLSKRKKTKIGQKKKANTTTSTDDRSVLLPSTATSLLPLALSFVQCPPPGPPPHPDCPSVRAFPSPPLRRLSAGGAGWALGALDGHVRPVEAAPRQ